MSDKRNFISQLVDLVDPPQKPSDATTTTQWCTVQEELGTTLPDDLRDFSAIYGSGTFKHPSGDVSIEVFNLFSRWYRRRVADMQKALRLHTPSFNVFPNSPGLLCWALDEYRNRFCWLTEGGANLWPVVVITADGKHIQFDTSLSGLLVQLFSGHVTIYPDMPQEWFRRRAGQFRFEPAKPFDASRWPPLLEAIVMLDRQKARRLLDAGVDPNTTFPSGDYPLFVAIENASDVELVKILLAAGADPNVRGEEGRTALQLAASSDFATHCVELLLSAGSEVSSKDEDGWSPLLLACSRKFEDRVRILLAHGADPNDRLPNGKTALQLARTSDAICRILKEAGATE